jgi:hypothetical protein
MMMPKKKSVQAPNSNPTSPRLETLDVVHPHAAAADIGRREIWVSWLPDREGQTVGCFGTFTPDRESLLHWLLENQVDTGGVHWRVLDPLV